jgi:hypothetical protein
MIEGPRWYQWDLSLRKNFALFSTARMQLRADVFNVFNRVNFENPETTVTDDDYGAISDAKIPRQMQFSVRLDF